MDSNLFTPKNEQDWREWLKEHHQSQSSIWLILYKKNAKVQNLTWSKAVDQALCFGWIDGVKKTVDKDSYKQYFSKRKPNSTWSKINKDKIEKLSQKGLMYPQGEKVAELAKLNGSWTLLDAVEDLIIPEDFETELSLCFKAKQNYLTLSKSKKKQILYKIYSAKRHITRQKRINEICQALYQNKIQELF